jgi:hypothetical protein
MEGNQKSQRSITISNYLRSLAEKQERERQESIEIFWETDFDLKQNPKASLWRESSSGYQSIQDNR